MTNTNRSLLHHFDTAAMIAAFVPDEAERRVWLHMLDNCREAHGCPCTNTTHTRPRMRSAATGFQWVEDETFVPGRPVANCGICYGTGVGSLAPDEEQAR